jgi:hypothetical protein
LAADLAFCSQGMLAHGDVRTVAAMAESTNKGGSAPAALPSRWGVVRTGRSLSARQADRAGVDPASWKYPLER